MPRGAARSRARPTAAALLAGLLAWTADPAPARAAVEGPAPGVPLAPWTDPDLGAAWLTLDLVRGMFPDADGVEPLQAEPRVAPVFADGALRGYVFATRDVTESLGFSSLEFVIAVGLRLDGTLAGARVVEHREPIIDLIMLQDLVPRFASQYADVDIRAPLRVHLSRTDEPGTIDGISSATISAVLFNEAILRSARMVARAKGIRLHDHPVMDIIGYRQETFAALVGEGVIGRLRVTREDAAAAGVADPDVDSGDSTADLYVYAFERDGGGGIPAPEAGLLLDLYAAPVMTPTAGRNILGDQWHDLFVSGRNPDDLVLAVMALGPYAIDGEKHLSDGPFRRLRLLQDGKTFGLDKGRYRFLGFLHGSDKPPFSEMGLFWIPGGDGIDPVRPWRLEVLVEGRAGGEEAWFGLDYALDEEFVLLPTGLDSLAAEDTAPAWMAAWDSQRLNIALLLALLAALAGVLAGMDRLARRPRLLLWTRLGFLALVLVWLGWYAGAQVTIVNVLTWLHAAVTAGGLAVLLSDPLLVVLMGFVIVTFFLFGRGIYCGWLCPFGALQELLAKAAQALRLRQIAIGHRAHRLLWPVKYVVLAVLVGLSFHSMDMANAAAEVEPFKTAISLRFERDWPYVAYALVLLGAGLFVERFFCRFLCPLGAAMALGGLVRLRNPLRRRAECGSPCQLCARRCPIDAIAPDGAIRMDECFYCLDCQVTYHDAHVCPPLVRAARPAAAVPGPAGVPAPAAGT